MDVCVCSFSKKKKKKRKKKGNTKNKTKQNLTYFAALARMYAIMEPGCLVTTYTTSHI